LLFSFALEDTISKIQKQRGFGINGTHQLLVCADVNLVGENLNITKRKTQALLNKLV
jgi:hypothetical protein